VDTAILGLLSEYQQRGPALSSDIYHTGIVAGHVGASARNNGYYWLNFKYFSDQYMCQHVPNGAVATRDYEQSNVVISEYF